MSALAARIDEADVRRLACDLDDAGVLGDAMTWLARRRAAVQGPAG
jgi:hypothetical protein